MTEDNIIELKTEEKPPTVIGENPEDIYEIAVDWVEQDGFKFITIEDYEDSFSVLVDLVPSLVNALGLKYKEAVESD